MLVVVRHAQSMANAGFATADPESIALTAAGEEQARALAMTWSAAPDRIFTSRFLRARQTSQPLAERFKMVVAPWGSTSSLICRLSGAWAPRQQTASSG